MYKFSNNELDVQGIKVFNSILIKGLKDGTLYIDDVFISKNVDTTSASLKIFKDYLFFDKNGFACNFNLHEKCLYQTGKYIGFPNTLIENEFICSYNSNFENNIFNWDIGIYDFKSKVLLKKIDYLTNRSILLRLSPHEVIVYFKNGKIGKSSLSTGEYNWEISLEHYGEIVSVLGVVENTLWIWFTKDQLIGIDVNNGEITSHLFPLQPILKDIVGYISHKYFIEKEQSLYFFHRSYLIQVNLLDNTTHLLWKNQEYEIGLSVFTDDYIYFIGGKNQGVFKNGIGIFDRKTNQVIWETTFELDDYVVLKEIQYSNDKIYVLDTAGVLRIFNKEE